MKSNKKLKKIIMGGVGFSMAVVVFFVGSMQSMRDVTADVRVFDKITEEYPSSDEFSLNVLEIVPASAETSKEFGYFLQKQNSQKSPMDVSHGNVHGVSVAMPQNPAYGYWDAERNEYVQNPSEEKLAEYREELKRYNNAYKNSLYQMRTYGLIRPVGADGTGLYPIYAIYNNNGAPVFSNYKTDLCEEPYDFSFVKGVYEMGAGDYNIAEGYSIDESGRICKIEKVLVLSDNGVVSENNPTYDPVTNTIANLVPVTDIDLSALSLPRSATIVEDKPAVEYITQASQPGTGNVKFTRSETVTNKMQYYGLSDQQLYYAYDENLYFYNSDYFKEYVLGSKSTYKDRQISYSTVNAKDVTKEQIEAADLIYISGKSVSFEGKDCDISEEIMLAIYNKEVLDRKAVMMDYACYSSKADTNVSKLAVLLWRESQSEMKTAYASAYTDQNDPNLMTNVDFMKGDILKDLKASMMTGANGNFVTGNVYVYNHHMSDFDDPKSMIDAGDMFANGDFNSAYTANVMQQGFSAVLGYITATNKNSTTGSMLPSVTPAVAIQYILIGDGNPLTIMKNTLNVLEIQPVMSFLFNETRGSEDYGYLDENSDVKQNRDAFVLNYLSNYYDDKAEHINFTSMSVDEFNGRNDDLIETYDIIYIGSEMGDRYFVENMKTATYQDGKYDVTRTVNKDLPEYKDTKMNGNVYYNIGDKVTVDRNEVNSYFLDGEETTDSRFAGRDITKNKLEKLKLFLESEGLILVEKDLLAENKVNPTAVKNGDNGRVDNASNMYELLQYSLGYRFNPDAKDKEHIYQNASTAGLYDPFPNLVSVADIVSGLVEKTAIEQYVATEKLTLTLMEQPREYSYSLQAGSNVMDPSTVQYMEENSDGTREMKYEFIISSDMDSSSAASTYTPHLYVDVNKDGKYSLTSEDVRDVKIVIKASGQEAERAANNSYVLYKDVAYVMTRELDESFSGYIKWKLSIQSNTYANSHASEEGSTVVKNKGSDELIKILQITRSTDSTLDLQQQNADPNSLYGKYLAAVPGYRVEIRTMKMDEFERDFDEKWKAYQDSTPAATRQSLEEYALTYFDSIEIVPEEGTTPGLYGADMLVLGFADYFPSFSSEDAVTAVQSYMESEKPVLLAHDFIMFYGRDLNVKYLRQHVGMDRYGITQNIVESTVGSVTVAELVNAARQKKTGAAVGDDAKILHSGIGYTRSKDFDRVRLIESTGKSVAYQPGDARMSTLKETQGLSNYTAERYRESDRSYMHAQGTYGQDNYGGGDYLIDKINDGQITSFPYVLPDQFRVNGTHGQYFQLDLDTDDDDDGESDVVVWYTLGEKLNSTYNPWGKDASGPTPSDGYYIYNKGNITYTGAGHANMTWGTDTEAQLFVNTLFAAYNAANVEPAVSFFEEAPDVNTKAINSLTVPYDENVTGDSAIDSSVLKDAEGQYRYHFVNPNPNPDTAGEEKDLATPMYFRLSDSNFVRGTKYMQIEYYLKAKGEADDTFTLDDGTTKTVEMLEYKDTSVPVVNITDKMATYSVENKALSHKLGEADLAFLESGVVYGFYLPLSYLENNSQVTIYIKAKTRIYTVSSQTGLESVKEVPGYGIGEMTVTKADLLDLK